MEEKLTFEDVALVPQYNNILSRTTPVLETWLTKNIKVQMPLIPSNMDTVIGDDLADILVNNGSMPIFHRFTDIETQKNWIKKYKDNCFISCGLNNIEQTIELLNLGARGVCIDIAHGHSDSMIKFIKKLKEKVPNKDIIAGNVCTSLAFHDLVNAGADAIKVGVGGGSACTTRIVTGFGVPQFSALLECGKIAEKLRIPMIADGGIKTSRDVVLSLAAGASTVMIGGLFSKTNESASEKITDDTGQLYCKYRGQASKEFQDEFYGKVKKGTVPEGIQFKSKCTGSSQELIDKLCGGLRSGLTYGGAKSIKELQRKREFVKTTSNYMKESNPRPY